jgi:hypothetical protein
MTIVLNMLENEIWETFSNIWKKYFGDTPLPPIDVHVDPDISIAEIRDPSVVSIIENPGRVSSVDHTDVPLINIKGMLKDYSCAMQNLCRKHAKNMCDKVFIVLPLSITRDNAFYICNPRCMYKKVIEEKQPQLRLFRNWENDYPAITDEIYGLPADHYPRITEAKNMRDRYSALGKALQSQIGTTRNELISSLSREGHHEKCMNLKKYFK